MTITIFIIHVTVKKESTKREKERCNYCVHEKKTVCCKIVGKDKHLHCVSIITGRDSKRRRHLYLSTQS